MNYNKVILAGRLTRDPETKFSQKGTPICKFGMAVNHTWNDDQGEKRERAVFVEVDCFGRTAEIVQQYFKKGSPIFCDGRLNFESWEDKQTRKTHSKLFVVMDSFQFVAPKSNGEQD